MDTTLVLSGLPLLHPDVGIGVYTRRLIDGLLAHGIPARVLLPASVDCEGMPSDNIISVSDPPRRLHSLVREMMAAQSIASAAQRLPDAVFHSPAPIAASRRPARTIITFHDCIYRRFPRYLGRWGIRKSYTQLCEKYASGAKMILTDSSHAAAELTGIGMPREKIRVLYPTVGFGYEPVADDQVATLRHKYGLPSEFWLYVGGFDYRKNVEFLIASYAIARQKANCPPLVLAGRIPSGSKGPYCDVIGAIARNNLSATEVLRVGLVPEVDLPLLYAASSLFIYPSLYEGFGLPPAEAIAAGTPVLVADTSSLPEVVRCPLCRFDPVNRQQLVEKLVAGARDPGQFCAPLPDEFRPDSFTARYLELVSEAGK